MEPFIESVRLAVMRATRDSGTVPDASTVAGALVVSKDEVVAAFHELHREHVFVLEPGTDDRLRMANPFSAVPTPFSVTVGDRSYFGNCVWDGLGIIACLGGTGTMAAECADCGASQTLEVAAGSIVSGTGVATVGVPATHWWDDIIYT